MNDGVSYLLERCVEADRRLRVEYHGRRPPYAFTLDMCEVASYSEYNLSTVQTCHAVSSAPAKLDSLCV
jgi:hypothetical protein